MSARSSSSVACSAAVRTIRPCWAGLTRSRMPAQPLAHVVGQALGDAVRLGVGDQHDEPAGQRHLLGEAGALGPDRVLRDLADDQLAGPQDVLDAGAVAALLDVLGVVLDVAAVEHGVLRRGDVDERGLHARQHVLHPPDVDVAVDLADVVGRAADVVLDQVAALEHGDLGHVRRGPARTSGTDRRADRCAPGPAAARRGPRPARRRPCGPAASAGCACACASPPSDRARSPPRAAARPGATATALPPPPPAPRPRLGAGVAPAPRRRARRRLRPAAPGGCRRSAACARAPARRPRARPVPRAATRAAPGDRSRRPLRPTDRPGSPGRPSSVVSPSSSAPSPSALSPDAPPDPVGLATALAATRPSPALAAGRIAGLGLVSRSGPAELHRAGRCADGVADRGVDRSRGRSSRSG